MSRQFWQALAFIESWFGFIKGWAKESAILVHKSATLFYFSQNFVFEMLDQETTIIRTTTFSIRVWKKDFTHLKAFFQNSILLGCHLDIENFYSHSFSHLKKGLLQETGTLYVLSSSIAVFLAHPFLTFFFQLTLRPAQNPSCACNSAWNTLNLF